MKKLNYILLLISASLSVYGDNGVGEEKYGNEGTVLGGLVSGWWGSEEGIQNMNEEKAEEGREKGRQVREPVYDIITAVGLLWRELTSVTCD